MTQEIRWQYRFRNFFRAYSLLREALETEVEELNQLERDGVVHRFEYTCELAWNTLEDRLEYEGVILGLVTPRNVIREAVAAGLVANGQTWMDMLTDRKNVLHQYNFDVFETVVHNIRDSYLATFNELYQGLSLGDAGMSEAGLPATVLRQLQSVFAQYPDLTAVKLYGSYATGRATPRSDIDLATLGITDRGIVGRLTLDLEDLPIPQKCDVQAYESINYGPLKRHIDAWGVTIYQSVTSKGET